MKTYLQGSLCGNILYFIARLIIIQTDFLMSVLIITISAGFLMLSFDKDNKRGGEWE